MSRTAVLYRMETKDHICPYGLKSKDLLQRKGEELPDYFRRCAERGLGTPDWKAVAIKEEQVG